MASSQNGWPVLAARTSGSHPRLRIWTVPGTDPVVRVLLRDGSAGFLLVWAALWWHEKLDRIDRPHPKDDWGWADRSIRGATTTSNHASGTALDVDATEHPLGVRGTLLSAKALRLRWVLRVRLRGVLRWGGDYANRADEMHLEVDAPLERCETVARRLMRGRRGKAILDANPGARQVILS